MRRLNKQHWPHKVVYNGTDGNDTPIALWLEANVGRFRDRWYSIYGFRDDPDQYYFADERDATLFILRWL